MASVDGRGGLTPPTSQRDGRVTLTLDANPNDRITLPVNPEDIAIARPNRMAAIQTLTGMYTDFLGQGIIRVKMQGHTGWRSIRGDYTDGFGAYRRLRDLLIDYANRCAKGAPQDVRLVLTLDIPTGWESFRVMVEAAEYARSRSSPLLFRYSLSFVVLEDLLTTNAAVDPSPSFVVKDYGQPPVTNVVVRPPANTGPGSGNAGAGGTGGSGSTGDVVDDGDKSKVALVVATVMGGTGKLCERYVPDSDSPPTLGALAAWWYTQAAHRPASDSNAAVDSDALYGGASNLWVYIALENPGYFPLGKATMDTPLVLRKLDNGHQSERQLDASPVYLMPILTLANIDVRTALETYYAGTADYGSNTSTFNPVGDYGTRNDPDSTAPQPLPTFDPIDAWNIYTNYLGNWWNSDGGPGAPSGQGHNDPPWTLQ